MATRSPSEFTLVDFSWQTFAVLENKNNNNKASFERPTRRLFAQERRSTYSWAPGFHLIFLFVSFLFSFHYFLWKVITFLVFDVAFSSDFSMPSSNNTDDKVSRRAHINCNAGQTIKLVTKSYYLDIPANFCLVKSAYMSKCPKKSREFAKITGDYRYIPKRFQRIPKNADGWSAKTFRPFLNSQTKLIGQFSR